MTDDDFSLMRGGPVFRLLHGLGLLRPHRKPARLIALLLVLVAWVPLVLATARDGTLLGGTVAISFLGDASIHARLLLALPLLVLAAGPADRILRAAFHQLSRTGLVSDARRNRFRTVIGRACRLRDSHLPELACLALAFLPAILQVPVLTELPHVSGWHTAPDGHITAAGLWGWWVSMPLFRFVLLIWLWRFLLWAYMLWRLSRLGLDLRPPHPDGAGGIGFLGLAQQRFAPLAAAGGCVLSGSLINQFVYAGQTLMDVRYLVAGYILSMPLLLLAPLLLLMPPLLKAKRRAMYRYDALGYRAIRSFDGTWKKRAGDGDPSLLDSPQPSALADFSAMYANLARMSVVPVSRTNILWITMAAALPLLPLVFLAMSLDELALKLFSIIA
jgi:hypothetical protein